MGLHFSMTRWAFDEMRYIASIDLIKVQKIMKSANKNERSRLPEMIGLHRKHQDENGIIILDIVKNYIDDQKYIDARYRYVGNNGHIISIGSNKIHIPDLTESHKQSLKNKPLRLSDVVQDHPRPEMADSLITEVTVHKHDTILATDYDIKSNLIDNYPNEWLDLK